jgi:hypothetical protein
MRLIMIWILLLSGPLAQAMTQAEYSEALRIADQHVQRKNALASRPKSSRSRLETQLEARILGPAYRPGDSWVLAAYHEAGIEHRGFKNPERSHASAPTIVGLFRYEVKKVQRVSGEQRVHVEVTEVTRAGKPKVDPRVKAMLLVFGDGWEPISKEYWFEGATSPVTVSVDGIHARSTPWETLPLDPPRMAGALPRETPGPELLKLPAVLEEALQKAGGRFDPSGVQAAAQAFEQDDFFGRPVRMLWKAGDPWPLLTQTSLGQAVLVRKEAP